MDCPKKSLCPFYNGKMPMGSGLGAVYKKKYCTGSNNNCARWLVLQNLGPEYVPNTLFPGMLDVAAEIISSHQKATAGE